MSREMKDCGIPWIGDIPEGWRIMRLKEIADVRRGGSPRPIDDYIADSGYNWIKIGDTVKGSKYITSVRQKIKPEGLSKTRQVFSGDLLLTNSMSFGEPYILKVDGCIHDGWVAFSDIKNAEKEFLYYYLLSPFCKMQFDTQVAGGVVQNLNVDKIASTLIELPPLPEQKSIADFLNKKCAEIDEMIALQEKIIEELKAYKQSVITEAVTKGLNPDVPMKDSFALDGAIIPNDWEERKFSQICSRITDFVASGSFEDLRKNVKYLDTPDYAMLVRTTDLSNSAKSKGIVYVSEASYNFLKNSNLYGGEIVLPNVGSIGDVYIVPKDLYPKMTLAPNAITFSTTVVDKYYYYYFLSAYGNRQLKDISESTAMPKFNKTDLRQLRVICPPLSEQKDIAEYLDKKCSDIDSLISTKNAKIEELKEYKKSIIYEYVTGKKEVN